MIWLLNLLHSIAFWLTVAVLVVWGLITDRFRADDSDEEDDE